MSLAPNVASPITRPMAHIDITHKGIHTLSHSAEPDIPLITSLMAASGHIALATSLAPWAKERRATANIRGRLNNLLMNFFQFLNTDECLKR